MKTDKLIYQSKSFVLGKCRCGCDIDIDIITHPSHGEHSRLKRFKHGHNARGATNPGWKNGISKHSSGYKLILKPDHPFSIDDRYVYEHRLVMEKHLGRYLDPINEVVHHKNGIKSDNRIENLELMTLSEHTRAHQIIDMSNRVCANCGTKTTSVNRLDRPDWQHNLKGEMICKRCYRHEYWLKNHK